MAATRGSVDDDTTAAPTVERTPPPDRTPPLDQGSSVDPGLSVETTPSVETGPSPGRAQGVGGTSPRELMIDPMPAGQMLVPATPGTAPSDLPPLLIVPEVHPLTSRPLGLAFPVRGDEVAAATVEKAAGGEPVLETPHQGSTRAPFTSSILRRRATAVMLGAVAASSALIWLGLWASNTPSLNPGAGLERPPADSRQPDSGQPDSGQPDGGQADSGQPGDIATGQPSAPTDAGQGDAGQGEGQPVVPSPGARVEATAVTPVDSIARVTAAELVTIEQRLEWPGGDGDTLLVSLPAPQGLVGAVAGARPEVVVLRASVDGSEVDVEEPTGDDAVWTIRADPSSSDREVLLDYTLDGAVVPSRPSEAGRALALVVPLLPAGFEGDPVPIMAEGPQVLNVQCLGVPFERALCGQREIGGWYIQPPPGADPYILLQVDLLAGN